MPIAVFLPWVSVVSRQTGLTVRSLSVVSAVALACLVVTVSSKWVAVPVALARHTSAATCQG